MAHGDEHVARMVLILVIADATDVSVMSPRALTKSAPYQSRPHFSKAATLSVFAGAASTAMPPASVGAAEAAMLLVFAGAASNTMVLAATQQSIAASAAPAVAQGGTQHAGRLSMRSACMRVPPGVGSENQPDRISRPSPESPPAAIHTPTNRSPAAATPRTSAGGCARRAAQVRRAPRAPDLRRRGVWACVPSQDRP